MKKRGCIIYGVLVILLFALQSTIFSKVTIFGTKPQLTLMLTIATSIVFGYKTGTITGAIVGLFQGLLASSHLGLDAILLMFTGLLAGKVSQGWSSNQTSVVLIIMLIFSAFYSFMYFLLTYGIFGKFNLIYAISVISKELIWTFLLSIPMFLLVRKIGEYARKKI
jgi:rod shape-determining protein MreD